MKRVFGQWELRRGKIAGTILVTLSVVIFSFFGFLNLNFSQQLPPSTDAPHVGQKAPDFTLPDQHGTLVSLTNLLKPAGGMAGKRGGVILIFYRGYW
jgi:cytochrome oxidase Cu insertion factor (SCO1/SenC/PrrC family)